MKEVQLDKLPPCNFCKAPAEYDAPTVFGPWAYMCEGCLAQYACGDPARIGSKITAKGEDQPRFKTVNNERFVRAVAIDLYIYHPECVSKALKNHPAPKPNYVSTRGTCCHHCKQPIYKKPTSTERG